MMRAGDGGKFTNRGHREGWKNGLVRGNVAGQVKPPYSSQNTMTGSDLLRDSHPKWTPRKLFRAVIQLN